MDYFHAWTIAADGRQLQAKDTDFTDVGAYGDADMQATERFRIAAASRQPIPAHRSTCETEATCGPIWVREIWQIQAPFLW